MSDHALVESIDESAVVIGGGTSGLGLASALRFAQEGAPQIALLARNPERGAAAVTAIREQCPDVDVRFIQTDCSDPESVMPAVDRVHEAFGKVSVLVSAIAATEAPDLFFRIPVDRIVHHLTAPALPPIYLTKAAYPLMQARGGGVIVNIASDAAKVPTPGESVLGAAQAAISMFSRGVALEGKRDGIRVNVITPSIIGGTPTTEQWLAEGFSKKLFEGAIKAAALGVVVPEELAELVVFLAGPAASKITGQTVSMNGGISVA